MTTTETVLRRHPITQLQAGDVLITSWDSPRVIEEVRVGGSVTVLVLRGFGESHHANSKRLTVRRPA